MYKYLQCVFFFWIGCRPDIRKRSDNRPPIQGTSFKYRLMSGRACVASEVTALVHRLVDWLNSVLRRIGSVSAIKRQWLIDIYRWWTDVCSDARPIDIHRNMIDYDEYDWHRPDYLTCYLSVRPASNQNWPKKITLQEYRTPNRRTAWLGYIRVWPQRTDVWKTAHTLGRWMWLRHRLTEA